MNTADLQLYLVTNRYDYPETDFLHRIETACKNGVTMVQLREKTASTRQIYDLGLAVKAITDRYQIPLIIDDRLDICLAIGAAGVHIGAEDLPVSLVRQLLGPEKIIGVSVKNLERAKLAQDQGADYLGVGAIFPTQTKANAPITSVATLKIITENIKIPVVAIGGINPENISLLKKTDIAGVAVVSAIMQASEIDKTVNALKTAVKLII